MTTDSYVIAWACYVVGGLGLFAFWCWVTQAIGNRSVKFVLRLVMLVMILFPFNIGGGYDELAPGFLMVLLETVFEGTDAFARVGVPLLTALGVTLVLGTGAQWFFRKRLSAQQARAQLDGAREELLQQSTQRTEAAPASADVERRDPTL